MIIRNINLLHLNTPILLLQLLSFNWLGILPDFIQMRKHHILRLIAVLNYDRLITQDIPPPLTKMKKKQQQKKRKTKQTNKTKKKIKQTQVRYYYCV